MSKLIFSVLAALSLTLGAGFASAAPIVSGIAGLMRALDPSITHDEIGDILPPLQAKLCGSSRPGRSGRLSGHTPTRSFVASSLIEVREQDLPLLVASRRRFE